VLIGFVRRWPCDEQQDGRARGGSPDGTASESSSCLPGQSRSQVVVARGRPGEAIRRLACDVDAVVEAGGMGGRYGSQALAVPERPRRAADGDVQPVRPRPAGPLKLEEAVRLGRGDVQQVDTAEVNGSSSCVNP